MFGPKVSIPALPKLSLPLPGRHAAPRARLGCGAACPQDCGGSELQAAVARLTTAGDPPMEVVIGAVCSGSEVYLTAFPELQAAVRAAVGWC